MKVLLASHSSGLSGGAELYFLELVSALQVDGRIDPVATTPEEGPLAEALRSRGIPVHCIPTPLWTPYNLFKTPGGFRRLARRARTAAIIVRYAPQWVRLVRKTCPDLVVTNTATVPLPGIAARLTRTPHVWTLHEFVTPDHGLQYLLGEKVSQRIIGLLSNEIIANSYAVIQHFSPPIDPERIHVVHCAIEPRPIAGNVIVPGSLRLLMLGRLTSGKGCEIAIRSLGYLRGAPFDVSLRLVGDISNDYLEYLREISRAVGVDEIVEFVGFTRHPENEIENSNVLLMCSSNEAFGRVTAEALVNGRPVIGARGGGTEELIEDGFDGLLFTPGEVTSLAHAISILGSDPDLLARMSRNATARNARRFSVDRQLNASIDIFAAATLARAHDEG